MLTLLALLFWALVGLILIPTLTAPVKAGCYPVPVTPDTPTGIAGCERWGAGTASEYGPGFGAATNWCTWQLRHSSGCGWVTITSGQTGLSVNAPVIDYCDCFTGTADERIVDLQYGAVAALALDQAIGLWPVTVYPASGPAGTKGLAAYPPPSSVPLTTDRAAAGLVNSPRVPDTAMQP